MDIGSRIDSVKYYIRRLIRPLELNSKTFDWLVRFNFRRTTSILGNSLLLFPIKYRFRFVNHDLWKASSISPAPPTSARLRLIFENLGCRAINNLMDHPETGKSRWRSAPRIRNATGKRKFIVETSCVYTIAGRWALDFLLFLLSALFFGRHTSSRVPRNFRAAGCPVIRSSRWAFFCSYTGFSLEGGRAFVLYTQGRKDFLLGPLWLLGRRRWVIVLRSNGCWWATCLEIVDRVF